MKPFPLAIGLWRVGFGANVADSETAVSFSEDVGDSAGAVVGHQPTHDDVTAGRKALVDDLGRVLEVEIELEHGLRSVIAKPHGGDARRNPGPIASTTLVDAGGAANTPGNDDGTPDQGPGDN